jgi:hypothetical protein
MNRFEQLDKDQASVPAPVQEPAQPTNRFEQLDAPSNIPQPPPRSQPELRAARYSPSERAGNMAQDALIAMGAQPYVAGRVGRGALSAASFFPPIGATLAGLDLGYHATGENPDLRKAAFNALGVIPAATMARRAYSGMPQRAIAPEEAQLTRATNTNYDAWRSSPVVREPAMMSDLTNQIATALTQGGHNRVKADKIWSALDEGRSLRSPTGMRNTDFETLRRGFEVKNPLDVDNIAAARTAREVFDNYMAAPPPQFIRSGTPQQVAADQANLLAGRSNTAARKRSEVVTKPLAEAELQAEIGKDPGKVLERRINALETTPTGQRSTRGFTGEERDIARDAITDSMTRRLDTAGRAMQNVTGARSLYSPMIAGGAGGGAWAALGLEPTMAAAAGLMAPPVVNMVGRGLQGAATNRMTQAVERAGENLRMRSQLAQNSGRFGYLDDPQVMAKDASKYLMYPWLNAQGNQAIDERNVPFGMR